jgi:membrane protease YdiL (CAAX protease family)
MISTAQPEEVVSKGNTKADAPGGSDSRRRGIPATFMIVAWMAGSLVLLDNIPWLPSLGEPTWVGEVLRTSVAILWVACLLPSCLKRDGLSVRDLGFENRPFWLDLVQGCAGGAIIYAFSIALFYFLIREPAVNLLLSLSASRGAQVVAKWMFIVMLAPIVEELLLRACIIVPLRARWGRGSTRDVLYALLSGVLFACLHSLGHRLYYVGYTFIGTAFAVLYQRTGSLRAVMIAHAFMNASVLTVGAILK